MPTLSPWFQQIFPVSFATVQGTWAIVNDASVYLSWYLANSAAPAVNDAISWPVVLSAGTWKIEALHIKAPSAGIATFALDGTSVGTVDGYNVGTVYNSAGTVAGITVAADGKKTLSLTVATKNASSSGFRFNLEYLTLTRTA